MSESKTIPEVRFNLKSRKDKNASTLILAIYRYHGKKLVYSTRHKIRPGLWDDKKSLPKKNHRFYSEIKGDLELIEDAILSIYSNIGVTLRSQFELSDFKQKLDVQLKRSKPRNQPNSFLGYIDSYISRRELRPNKNDLTIKKFRSTLNHLKNFAYTTGQEITFDSINWAFREDFLNYLYSPPRSHSRNTASKYIKTLCLFIKEAHRDKVHTNDIYLDSSFRVKEEKYKKVVLTPDEIKLLQKADLEGNDTYILVRDLFLISCFSGLRYSDLIRIKPENIIEKKGVRLLHIFTKKTNTPVYIPLVPELDKILKKYNYHSPPHISSQKLNLHIKGICKIAKITIPTIQQYNQGGKTQTKTISKCELISVHCGRRTWATNMYGNYDTSLLMQVTGHTSERQFLEYVGAKKEDLAVRLSLQIQKLAIEANEDRVDAKLKVV